MRIMTKLFKKKVQTVENHNWMKPKCIKCPYFVDGRINKNKLSQCVRPFGERCLAEGLLIQMAINNRSFLDEN